jgi:hypothetical protein
MNQGAKVRESSQIQNEPFATPVLLDKKLMRIPGGGVQRLESCELNAKRKQNMPASFIKLFREGHRDTRLPQIRLGQDWNMEVRPLSLTPKEQKLLSIKESAPNPHEPKSS